MVSHHFEGSTGWIVIRQRAIKGHGKVFKGSRDVEILHFQILGINLTVFASIFVKSSQFKGQLWMDTFWVALNDIFKVDSYLLVYVWIVTIAVEQIHYCE